MKMKLYIVGMLLGFCVFGCDKAAEVLETNIGAETGGNHVQAQESTEILNPPKGEIHYTQAELQIVEEVLGNQENAKNIMKQLNSFGIYNIAKVELLVPGKEQELKVVTSDNREFIIHYYEKNYHIYAIEKNDTYIYAEYQ